MKKIFYLLVLLSLFLICCSSRSQDTNNSNINNEDNIEYFIDASSPRITMEIGDEVELTYITNIPYDISFKIKKDGILELNDNKIKALKSGDTEVELYFIDGDDRISSTIKVKVNKEPVDYYFSYGENDLVLEMDVVYNLKYDTNFDGDITFYSEDENVAKILSDTIYTFNPGEVNIVASFMANGERYIYKLKITVKEPDPMCIITITNNSYEVKNGTTFIDFLEEKFGEKLALDKYNYKFDGYYLDSEFNERLDLYSIVSSDATLYPKYSLIEVSFDVDNVYRIVGGKNIVGNVVAFTKSYAYDLSMVDLSEYTTIQVKYDLILDNYKITQLDTLEIPYDGFLLAFKKDSKTYASCKELLKSGKLVYLDNYSIISTKRITINKQNPTTEVSEVSVSGVTAPFVACYDATNKKMLYTKSPTATAYPASTTKIITAITALKYCDYYDSYICGNELDMMNQGSSPGTAGMIKGQKWTIRDLLYAALLPSGNDAAYGLAECTIDKLYPGNTWSARERIDKFAELMNETAEAVGCVHSHFMTPDGNSYYTSSGAWDERLSKHYVCAEDMIRIASYAFRIPELCEIVRTTNISITVSGKSYTFTNTNKLLRTDTAYYYTGTVGMKTGTTTPGGNCLVSGVFKNGRLIIVAMLKSSTSNGRYEDSLKVYNAVFPK